MTSSPEAFAYRLIPDAEQRRFHEWNRMRARAGMEPSKPAEWDLAYELALILRRPSGLHPGLVWIERSWGGQEPLPDEGWASVEWLRRRHFPGQGYIRLRDDIGYDVPTGRSVWTEVEFLGGYLGLARYAIWRSTGDIYTVGLDGHPEAVDDDPTVTGVEALRKIRGWLDWRGRVRPSG